MKKITGVIISVLSFFIGNLDLMLKILICVMIMDYITGVICAIYNKELSSKTGFNGILKKLCILSVICLSNFAGQVVGVEELRHIAISFYMANEAISILENACRMGIAIPEKLKDVLKQLEKK